MKLPPHWQDPVNAVMGLLVLTSPWFAGYALVQPALANATIVGAFLFTAAVGAAVVGRRWVEWAVAAIGTWLCVSPWALAFSDERASVTAFAIGGAVLVLCATTVVIGRGGR